MKLKYSLIAAALFIGVGAQAQKGWKNLFNGKDLTGWKQLDGKAKFEAKNKEIVGVAALNTPNTFLATEQEYGDFILELECLADTMLNSGIQIRRKKREDIKREMFMGIKWKLIRRKERGAAEFATMGGEIGCIRWN